MTEILFGDPERAGRNGATTFRSWRGPPLGGLEITEVFGSISSTSRDRRLPACRSWCLTQQDECSLLEIPTAYMSASTPRGSGHHRGARALSQSWRNPIRCPEGGEGGRNAFLDRRRGQVGNAFGVSRDSRGLRTPSSELDPDTGSSNAPRIPYFAACSVQQCRWMQLKTYFSTHKKAREP